MKYETTDRFLADFRHLTPEERRLFLHAIQLLNAAFDQRGHRPLPRWPASLCVKSVQGAPGIWELTWSFSGPDGRATFEFTSVDGDPAIRWRRVGTHRIFDRP